ncbi:MAG: ribonuclease HII [Alphaproteobacteria bacterium]|nr:ribonuclease HII [Alphaproteobacteria bacterium]
MPNYKYEESLINIYGFPVCGIDEAGRGSWAGPVVAAAVILDPKCIPSGLDDSKKISAVKRAALFDVIMGNAKVGVGIGTVERIDRDNILQATFWAMHEAVRQLCTRPSVALVDGRAMPPLPCPTQSLIRGDSLSCSVAAASIIAKVTRDRLIIKLAEDFLGYGWERNMAYGTKEHQEGLRTRGVTPHHRRSFRPIRSLLS